MWLDLLSPTPEEIAQAEALIGTTIPTLEDLTEIEASRRLRNRNGALTLTAPSAAPHPAEEGPANVGFVLSQGRLATIRFTPSSAFDAVGASFEAGSADPANGLEVFTRINEEIVDRIADGLERLAADLGTVSAAAFHRDDKQARRPVRINMALRAQLRQVGRLGNRLSEVRNGLLGLVRVVAFAEQFGCDASQADLKARLTSVRHDIASLNEYQEHLSNKVQFVLDALVGLIGIAQNEVFKVLTIVSIAGIPPTVVAGVYGMNFKYMPELNWPWGYPFGLAMVALSTIIPLIWFKIRGWF
ncbi:MAG: magnesium transporter CorA family protein, partial [Caulobacteraceae bacterium]|nr:magnesium transporter CorA family protein [Caulobacteraceae bacterium]